MKNSATSVLSKLLFCGFVAVTAANPSHAQLEVKGNYHYEPGSAATFTALSRWKQLPSPITPEGVEFTMQVSAGDRVTLLAVFRDVDIRYPMGVDNPPGQRVEPTGPFKISFHAPPGALPAKKISIHQMMV